ncbi:hypothetical protein D9757_010757 [Collybiopsis confluens]|uniref:Uncharacterized protein n=1 Tax=Collybiopsis confluens TaxID=2823264 RepID=A0A8H5H8M4_9AGAR|nr:hypothetical protein D9757_010757 [Collybiopsis confluens]
MIPSCFRPFSFIGMRKNNLIPHWRDRWTTTCTEPGIGDRVYERTWDNQRNKGSTVDSTDSTSKSPPIIIAALPITDSLSVPDLLKMHRQIIFGLLDHNVRVASYSCDGTETERSLQRHFAASAASFVDIKIPYTRNGDKNKLFLQVPVFWGVPIIMVQDSEHALKTFRNNLFSGARLLVMGNLAAFFQQIHDLAFEDDSPLYHRDVNKLDRQDDNAACRLFLSFSPPIPLRSSP